jgi:hypothetical protein
MYWTRRSDQAASARALSKLHRHHLASAMHRGASRDELALGTIEDALREHTGRVPPLPAPIPADRLAGADSVEGTVAENVVRTRTLQTELHQAARHPGMPGRMRAWLRDQIVALEHRNVRLRRILFDEPEPPRPRRPRSPSRGSMSTALRPRLRRGEAIRFVAVTSAGAALFGMAAGASAQLAGLTQVGLLATGLAGAGAGGALGLLCAVLSVGVPLAWHLRRQQASEVRDAQGEVSRG